MNGPRDILRHLLTEGDNETYDFFRGAAVIGVFVFLGLAVWNADKFDPQTFGIGFGTVLVAAGAAVRLNEGPAETAK